MGKLFESDDYILVNVVLLFLLINFNLEIGTIYGMMAIIDWLAYYLAFDRSAFKMIPLEIDKRKRFTAVLYAMGAYVVFIIAVNFITATFGVAAAPGQSSFEYISQLISSTFSTTPILYGSSFLKLLVWGVLIPIIETRFFFRTLMQWALHAAGVKFPQKVFSLPSFGIAAFFGGLFAAFHIVAKGITNNSALLVTFFFGFMSVLMVIYFKEATQAIFLHIITNTIATMQQLGTGFFEAGAVGVTSSGLMTLGIILLVSWFLMFQQIPFIKKKGTRS